ncbi:hypothetical protein, partial [Streptomyces sp. SID685]|uniref:hypothetical protein n=1 Tax=Streptomyces sp. SID685 TaxID=2690322 RepID=UPI001F2CC4C3
MEALRSALRFGGAGRLRSVLVLCAPVQQRPLRRGDVVRADFLLRDREDAPGTGSRPRPRLAGDPL